jgi:hypothetical protein
MRAWQLSNRHRRIRNDEALFVFASREQRLTKTVTSRIGKLEHQFGIAKGKPGILLVVSVAAWRHPLNVDTCMNILLECGFVPTGPGINMVDLLDLRRALMQRNWRSICANTAGSSEVCTTS